MGKYIAILLFISIGINLLNTNANIVEAGIQSNSIDTIAFNSKKTIKDLRKKVLDDSTRIADLNNAVASLGDSITSIKDNQWAIAIQKIEEQLKRIETEKENTFVHFKAEIEQNLRTIFHSYDEEFLRGEIKENRFTAHQLKNTYIKKYTLISSNEGIIKSFMVIASSIELANIYSNAIRKQGKSTPKNNIETLFSKNEYIFENLRVMFTLSYNLDSYKEFEKVDLSVSHKLYTKDEIKELLSGSIVKNAPKTKL